MALRFLLGAAEAGCEFPEVSNAATDIFFSCPIKTTDRLYLLRLAATYVCF